MLDFIRPQKRFPLAVTRHALRGGAALRVAHLTDLHLEDGANAAWRIVNAQHPDIICFTGDFACRRAQFATADVYCSILRGLRARYGKFAVTGNHDILGAAGKAPQLICRAGFTLLQNEAARVEISGQNVDILGLSTMKYDTPATAKRRFPLKGQQPGPAFRLGLARARGRAASAGKLGRPHSGRAHACGAVSCAAAGKAVAAEGFRPVCARALSDARRAFVRFGRPWGKRAAHAPLRAARSGSFQHQALTMWKVL